MQFDIRSNIVECARWLDDVQKKQLPFAFVLAMTKTAQDVKREEITTMKRVFDRPTPYALNALQVKPASKQNLIASVEFKEGGGTPAKRFLNPQVHGGPRSQKSSEKRLAALYGATSFAMPARGLDLNKYGNVNGSVFVRILSQLKISSDPLQNATGSKRSKGKRKASAFFIPKSGGMVMERKGSMVRPVLVFTKAPNYTKRFPFYETGERVVAERFGVNFEIAFQRAMATARVQK